MRDKGGADGLIRAELSFGLFPFEPELIERAVVQDVLATLSAEKHETILEKRRVDVRQAMRWAGWSDLFVSA